MDLKNLMHNNLDPSVQALRKAFQKCITRNISDCFSPRQQIMHWNASMRLSPIFSTPTTLMSECFVSYCEISLQSTTQLLKVYGEKRFRFDTVLSFCTNQVMRLGVY